jgi:3',5'-cyclic AMP phosphodiesterase CpdA
MNKAITFVHLTDLHISDPGLNDDHLHSDTSANMAAILKEVKRLAPAPAFIVASGDLTNHGDAASYVQLRRLLKAAEIDVPLLVALGNHDNRQGFYQGFLGQEASAQPYDHDAVIAGVHVIVIDSSVPNRIGGGFEPGQVDWLKARLDDHPELPKLIVSHHPPALEEDDLDMEWESLTCADTLLLRDLLKGRNILGILSGHIHYDRVTNWYGIPVVVGVGQHAATDPLELATGLRQLSGTGFAVGTVRPSGLTVSFVPQPADRRELSRTSYDFIRQLDVQRTAAANAAQ